MNAVDGATIERRIRINRPDDENTRCKVSRAWDPRKDFSQPTRPPTTHSTSNAISPQQEHTEPSERRPCRRGVISPVDPDEPAFKFQQRDSARIYLNVGARERSGSDNRWRQTITQRRKS